MEYELYGKIKKGNPSVLRELQERELPWAYFVCYRMTKDVKRAAELLRTAWIETVREIVSWDGCYCDSFRACLAKALYRLCDTPPEAEDDLFSVFEVPRIAPKFDLFVEEIDRLAEKERKIYLLSQLGDLGNRAFSELLGISPGEAKQYLYTLDKKAHPRENGAAYLELMRLVNEFKGEVERVFEQISIPELFISALEHDYTKIFHKTVKNGKTMIRKDTVMKPTNKNSAKTTQPNRRAAANKKKKIIISCVSALLAVVLVITLVSLFKKANMPALAYSTQYKIDEVTLGNVSTTISGSGSLTPVHSETLKASALLEALEEDSDSDDGDSASAQSESGEGMLNGGSTMPSQTPAVIVGGTVQSVAVRAGDIVDAGDEIATIIVESEETAEGEEATTRKLVAPYNAVILESYLHEGDAVTDSTSVVMLLSVDDGYTMTISVDENNISLIEFGQEVEISIDVSSEEMPTGYVTDISYNGSTSGSTTAYKISVTFDYVENTYPGMSVSAEIVIDRSEDGLLVPVSAIQTSGDTKYVYLAPSDAALADVYEDGELDVTKLTKVTVTEVASDGSYTLVEGDGLEEGDLVVVITMTSNETGSTASGGSGSGSFPGGSFGSGSFPGGSFPGGEMPDFGSFPFGS